MLPTRFSSLALLKYPKGRTDNLNPLNVVSEFVSKRFDWQRFLTLLFKFKSFFVARISLKMFWEKGLPQIWTTSLKDVCVVSSFYFTQKACSFTKNELLYMFFFSKILLKYSLIFFFFEMYRNMSFLENSLNPLMQVITKGQTYLNKLF